MRKKKVLLFIQDLQDWRDGCEQKLREVRAEMRTETCPTWRRKELERIEIIQGAKWDVLVEVLNIIFEYFKEELG
jgi:hypothetical protein